MRVEMSGMNWSDDWGEIPHEVIRTDAIHRVSPRQPKPVPIHSRHCNGQRGENKIEEDSRRPNQR